MIALFAISLIIAFISLVLSSQLAAPAWMWALDGMSWSLAVSAMAGLGIVLARLRVPKRWRPLPHPVACAAISLVTYRWLQDWLAPSSPTPRIDFWRTQIAAVSTVAAIFALVGGVVALSRGGAWYHGAAAGVAITAGLFSLGPLLIRAGVPVDWRAFLGLAGLGLGAFAMVEAARRVRSR